MLLVKLSRFLYELIPHLQDHKSIGAIKIVIECADERTAHAVKSAMIMDLRRQLVTPAQPEDPRKPITLDDLEVIGFPVEIRGRVT